MLEYKKYDTRRVLLIILFPLGDFRHNSFRILEVYNSLVMISFNSVV